MGQVDTANSGVVALRGEDLASAGTITFIRMCGDTNYEKLADAWNDEGLDKDLLLDLPTDTVACARAVKDHTGPHVLARQLKRKDHPNGWALVNEKTKQTLHHKTVIHVLPNIIGRLKFETPSGTKVSPNANGSDMEKLAASIKTKYAYHLDHLSTGDVSGWFVRLCRHLSALALRDTGGFYFIPAPHVPTWERMVKAIRAGAAHHVGLIPAMTTSEAVATILASLEAEAEAEANALFEEIASGDLGERALVTRGDRCAALTRKVQEYEKLLNVSLDGLQARLTELQGSLTAATMVAVNDENATGVLGL